MKAVVAAFNQEKTLVGAFSVIVQPVVEPMDRFAALEMNLVLVDKVDHPSLLHPHKKKMGQILWGAKHNDQRSLFPVCGLFRLPLSNTLSCVYGQLF